MVKRLHSLTFVACAVLVVLSLLSGCGGGSGSNAVGSTGSNADSPSGEPSASFLRPGSVTNPLVEAGQEGSVSERETASAVLAKNLEAREEADFATQCATLSQSAVQSVASAKKGAAATKACPSALKALATPLSKTKAIRADTLDGEIAALRVEGNQGQALYHGDDGKDYAMPMVKEGVHWLVAALLATELNPPEKTKSSSTGPSE
jgi:hypothetical protein